MFWEIAAFRMCSHTSRQSRPGLESILQVRVFVSGPRPTPAETSYGRMWRDKLRGRVGEAVWTQRVWTQRLPCEQLDCYLEASIAQWEQPTWKDCSMLPRQSLMGCTGFLIANQITPIAPGAPGMPLPNFRELTHPGFWSRRPLCPTIRSSRSWRTVDRRF